VVPLGVVALSETIEKREVCVSPRETEIARLIAQGHSNKEIAAQLGLSAATVGTYVSRVFHKLGVHSRAAMIAKLMQAGHLLLA
jgi:DNA-binding CsgD family transcriptional regulator